MISTDSIIKEMAKAIEGGDCNCPECCAKNGLAALGRIASVVPRKPDPQALAEAWSEMVGGFDLTSVEICS